MRLIWVAALLLSSGVGIAAAGEAVTVRARDKRHLYGRKEVEVRLAR